MNALLLVFGLAALTPDRGLRRLRVVRPVRDGSRSTVTAPVMERV